MPRIPMSAALIINNFKRASFCLIKRKKKYKALVIKNREQVCPKATRDKWKISGVKTKTKVPERGSPERDKQT